MENGTGGSAVRLGDYYALLRRQWPVVLLCLALGIGAAMAYLQWAPKEYRSTTSVLVTAMETDGASATPRGTAINLDTEAQLVTATRTVVRAAEALDVDPGTVGDRIGVSVPPNTEILDLSYVAGSAPDAQRGSLAVAEAYLEQRETTGEELLEAQADALQPRIDAVEDELRAALTAAERAADDSLTESRAEDEVSRLSQQLSTLTSNQNRLRTQTLTPGRIVTQPRLPASPSSPDPLITLAAGVVLGAALGLGLAALRHRADDVIRTPEDLVRRTRVPVAAVLTTRLHPGQVSIVKPQSADGRVYARLRNLVATSLEEGDRRVVLVAGVRRGGGPVAANLAASLARSGEDVLLVCADVFGPTAAALFDGEPGPGLAEVLAGETTLEVATRHLPSVPHLRVLTPGLDPDRADALLQTKGPRRLVDDALATASYVVIESPATSDGPDAQTLAGVADLAVLVVEAGQSSAREVLDAVAQVESVHAAVLGAVVARYARDGESDQRRAGAPGTGLEEPATVPAARSEAVDEHVQAEHVHDGSAVLPTGGRPQLVPPGSAAAVQR